MNRLTGLLCLVCLGMIGCATRHAHFGGPMRYEGEKPLTVAEVMADVDRYLDQEIRVHGTVTDLCKHAGCWMEIAEKPGDQPLFVKFVYDKKSGRVPPESVGHEAVVEGRLREVEISAPQRRHYAQEQGKSPEEIAKIIGPSKRLCLECPAARIEGVKPAEPRPCKHESDEDHKHKEN